MPILSVLMPCYNTTVTLDEALESLLNQTLADFEIVCVDDGSDDGTGEKLETWAGKEPRLKVFHQPHKGIIQALNAGLNVCSAPYVARMDADDRSRQERFQRQVDFLESHPLIDVVGCRVAGFPVEHVRAGFQVYMDWLNTLMFDEDIRRNIFIESPLPHPSTAFRREEILRLGGYQEHGWAEDYDLWLRLYLAGCRFAKIPDVLLDWREHPGRLSMVDRRYSLENFLRAKSHYLMLGPLKGRDALIIWGAGMVGRRLGKQLLRLMAPLVAYVDIKPEKIGKYQHGRRIISPEELPACWNRFRNPVLLGAVSGNVSRSIIGQHLESIGLREGEDWWSAA